MYDGRHSVTFFPDGLDGNMVNTWDDFGLIPTKRPIFDPPEVNYANYVQSSELDTLNLQANLNRRGIPSARHASWTFIAYHENVSDEPNPYASDPSYIDDGTLYNQPTLYSRLMYTLHGRNCTIRLRDDADEFFYRGLVEIKGWNAEDHFSEVTIEVTADPYKYVRNPVTVTISGQATYSFIADTKFITPSIVTVTPNGTLNSLTMGGFAFNRLTNASNDIVLKSLRRNTPVVINGELKTITENGANKFKDSELWAFPCVKPGVNLVTLSTSTVNVTISYTPRWM